MLQKYFPILGEINSPLAMLAALNFTSEATKVAISGISNKTLENLLWASVSTTEIRRKEIEVEVSELEKARIVASKAAKALRYRAAQAARSARKVAAAAHRIKAVRRPPITSKVSAKALKGLDISICRARAAEAQKALKAATNTYNTAAQAVETAIQGGDIRSIRSAVAALKAVVSLLEVRHLEFRFAREMLTISLARHSA